MKQGISILTGGSFLLAKDLELCRARECALTKNVDIGTGSGMLVFGAPPHQKTNISRECRRSERRKNGDFGDHIPGENAKNVGKSTSSKINESEIFLLWRRLTVISKFKTPKICK